jgi:hypothetical protein
MQSTELVPPKPVDLVAADEVEPVLVAEHDRLLELAARAVELRVEAADAEARLAQDHVDRDASLWMLVRFQRFLAEIRDEAEADADARLTLARREAERIRRARGGRDVSFVGALGVSSKAWFDIDLPVIEASEANSLRWLAPPPSPPATLAVRATPVMAVERVALVETRRAPIAIARLEPSARTSEERPAAANATSLPQVAVPSAAEFWPEERARIPWRRRRPVSASAALKVGGGVAALLALVVHFA